MAALLSPKTVKAAISLLPFIHLPPGPPMLPPERAVAVSRGRAGARGGLGAPPLPPRPAGPAASRRRPLGPRTLARTRSSRPRHVPGGGGRPTRERAAAAGGDPLSLAPPAR